MKIQNLMNVHGETIVPVTHERLVFDSNGTSAGEKLSRLTSVIGGTSVNLYHNWYFGNPINRHGNTTYTGTGITIDRLSSDVDTNTMTLNTGYITFTAGANIGVFSQSHDLAVAKNLAGYKMTLSVLVAGGQLYTSTFTVPNPIMDALFTSEALVLGEGNTTTMPSVVVEISDTVEKSKLFKLMIPAGMSVNIAAIKLEIHGTQTLAFLNDYDVWVLNEFPNYEHENLLCNQYNLDTGEYAGAVPVSGGGTGAITPEGALINFGLTATAQEINYTDGVTAPIQEQLDDKLPLAGGTVTGTLILSNTIDASDLAYNSPALVVGGMPTAQHLEFDGNEIQSKKTETTVGTLSLNNEGGMVHVGPGGLYSLGEIMTNGDIFISNDTSNQVQLQYDKTNRCLNFIFN